MDNQDYLNQISASSAPVGKITRGGGLSDFLHSKIVIIIGVTLLLFIVIAIIGSFMGPTKDTLKEGIVRFKYHVDMTSDSMDKYQPLLKSSVLRSSSASLKNSLSAVNTDITNYLNTKYKFKSSSKEFKAMKEDAQKAQEDLNDELFKAKINGNLDRVYAHKMAYEIMQFKSEESTIYKLTKDETLQAILRQSLDSLENLYAQFNDFSETKK